MRYNKDVFENTKRKKKAWKEENAIPSILSTFYLFLQKKKTINFLIDVTTVLITRTV